ncbi:MAG TPA: beta-L-arabinofuranosidase domain-containing protein, partial [Fimbriimonas sp.]|nr:beta-L-arabinofuranosidase domain-containing protein [Fimbriimonas sp.]
HLAGKHSNTQIPKLIGLARLYELTGDQKDHNAAEFFWETVVNHHTYVIGGNSNGEYLGPPDQLAHRLSSNTCETCNTYNMLKLTRHLFEWDPQAKYMDFYERAYYNHILGSQDPDTGGVTYFMPLGTGTHREYSDAFDNFTCCHGTGMENHTKHGDTAYFHSGNNVLWVNLFMPSELTWKENGAELKQETDFPKTGNVSITVEKAGRPFELKLRHPSWAAQPFDIQVNGQTVATSGEPSSYTSVNRSWKKGDKITFTLPMAVHEEATPDDAKRVAFLYGPIVLAADLGKARGPEPRTPVLVTHDEPVTEWVKPVAGEADTFTIDSEARPTPLKLLPFYTLHHDRYGVYFDKFTDAEWDKQEAQYREEEARRKDLEARTVDFFVIGQMQPERDHDLQSEKNDVRDVNGRSFRTPLNGGWFTFKVKVSPDKPNTLLMTYWGNDRLNPDFAVSVDGTELAKGSLPSHTPNRFFDVSYELPQDLTKGKSTVTVRIQATEGHAGPSTSGARVVFAK